MNRFLKAMCALGEHNMCHYGFAHMLVEQATRNYTSTRHK